jgi:hypothetical protein
MKKFSMLVCILALLPAMTGCIGTTNTRTTTTRAIDPDTGTEKVTMVEEDKDFWESGNLRMYYEADGKRVDAHQRLATEKITFIREQGVLRQADLQTPTERVLSNVVDTLLVAQIPTVAPAPSSPAPKTAVDMFERNLVPLTHLAVGVGGELLDLDIGGPFGRNSGEGSSSLEEVVVGGDLFINSEKADQYYLEEGSAWGGQENPTFSWQYETNTGNSTNSGQEGTASASAPSDKNTSLF